MKKLISLFFGLALTLAAGTALFALPEINKSFRIDSGAVKVRTFDKDRLDSYKSDEEFDYLKTREESVGFLERVIYGILNKLLGNRNYSGVTSFLYNFFLYLVVPATIIFIIWKLAGADRRALFYKGATKSSLRLQEDIEDIKEADLEKLVEDAIQSEDFKRAVRYSYLIMLRELTERGLIQWSSAKTNYDYLEEIKEKSLKASFYEMTHIFEYIWYGDVPINREGFAKASNSFQTFLKSVRSKVKV